MPWLSEMTEVARSRYLAELADTWLMDHPLESLKLAAVKIARTWSPAPLSEEYGGKTLYVVVGLVFGAMFDLLILLGLCANGLDRPVKWLLMLPAVYFTVGAALSVGSLRYPVPAEAPMAIVAASGLSWVGRRRETESQYVIDNSSL